MSNMTSGNQEPAKPQKIKSMKSSRFDYFSKKFWVILAIVTLLLAGIAVASSLYISHLTNKADPASDDKTNGQGAAVNKAVCSETQIKTAADLIKAKDTLGLAPIVEEIKKQDGHDQDANCLYILLQYNFLNNIPSGNTELLSKYESVQTSRSAAFGPAASNVPDMRQRAESLEKAEEGIEQQLGPQQTLNKWYSEQEAKESGDE